MDTLDKEDDSNQSIVNSELPQTRDIPLEQITVGEYCRRSDPEEDLEPLVDSIRELGVLQYPSVAETAPSQYTLLFGSRRFLACRKLGHQTITCLVYQTAATADSDFYALAENIARKSPSPVDQAKALKKIIEGKGLSQEALARKVGLPQSGVADRLSLLHLPDGLLAKIGTGPESPFKFTHAVALASLVLTGRPNRMIEVWDLANKTIRNKLSSTELKTLVRCITTGDFDRLPDKLRLEFLHNKYMTASMAKLYLAPEAVIRGAGRQGELLRQATQDFDRKKLERLILDAMEAKCSYGQTKDRLLGWLEDMVDRQPDSGKKDEASVQRLMQNLWEVNWQLKATPDEVDALSGCQPAQLRSMRNAAEILQRRLEVFLGFVETTLGKAEVQHTG